MSMMVRIHFSIKWIGDAKDEETVFSELVEIEDSLKSAVMAGMRWKKPVASSIFKQAHRCSRKQLAI